MKKETISMLGILVVAAALVAGCGSKAASGTGGHASMHMGHSAVAATPVSAVAASAKGAALRIRLDQLLGEHAILAIQATQRGLAGGKDFPAIAKQLDRNSVELSQAIASVYGAAAGKQFLDGKFLWRDHIRFFVDYTVATAKHDAAGQKKAVANLMTYIQTQAAFFAKATGLPKQALVEDLTAHVLQLKGQLDAYAAGRYAQAYTLTHAAYVHMFMTGDTLAAGIAKQKQLGSTTGKATDLQVTFDRMLGEHALLATWATQAGLGGGKNFPALGKQLDRNSVEISQAIGSLYGAAAAKQFLDGKNLWRAHIADFVRYTVATAKHDAAGKKRAVASLMAYIQTQASFFAKATGLPKQAVVNDLTAHVLQLKGALDLYDAKQYAKTFALVHGAYEHMYMTGADLAGGVAKQKGLS
jgi:hypothetical protein